MSVDPLADKYPSLSPYAYVANNPLNYIDPDGREIFPVHGTWSNNKTWKKLGEIAKASGKLFGDSNYAGNRFQWSGGNTKAARTQAATELVARIIEVRGQDGYDQSEAVTLVGHSHGGNVSVEAFNMMAEMEEFDGVELNLLSINTPVRGDYQLSDNAADRVNHVNIYDPRDPVQIGGGNSIIDLPGKLGELGSFTKEGRVGRLFNNARNIKVDQPQGLINLNTIPMGEGDYHNSHNRVGDWINKIDEK